MGIGNQRGGRLRANYHKGAKGQGFQQIFHSDIDSNVGCK
jgi:uncharacterized protein involved in tellurium resistance